jgi:hypothetical protein
VIFLPSPFFFNLENEKYQTLEPFIILENCKKCGQLEIFIYRKISDKKVFYTSYKTGHYHIEDIHTDNFFELVKGTNLRE